MGGQRRVCPWCDTELVWDEELGPDDTCPHCGNELGDYRSIRVRIEPSGELDPRAGTGLAGLEPVIRRILEEQDELPECAQCGEYMVLAGTQTVSEGFAPVVFSAVGTAFLEAPYRLNLYFCPSCFRAEYQLADEDRLKTAERLRSATEQGPT